MEELTPAALAARVMAGEIGIDDACLEWRRAHPMPHGWRRLPEAVRYAIPVGNRAAAASARRWALLDHARPGDSVRSFARRAGTPRSTVRKWVLEDAEWMAALEDRMSDGGE